ncbi:hypothetical protein E6C27_scaffold174G001140 [Cucumis melo var. makuwa]|uniref:Uncharacterized protein n=1 Tax=Cucumis melo var. makuwa TaxID=1194695 RepID=A0A5A7UD39_CUCMM|nr:hypothetical protein E6C27_scaffold174G001140 [Cucumis melo var. makuwa]
MRHFLFAASRRSHAVQVASVLVCTVPSSAAAIHCRPLEFIATWSVPRHWKTERSVCRVHLNSETRAAPAPSVAPCGLICCNLDLGTSPLGKRDFAVRTRLGKSLVRRDRQSGIDIDMIRVIRRDRSQLDCLSVSSGYTTDQFVLGVPLGSPKTSYVPPGSHVARVRNVLVLGDRGKGKGKLASDQK